MGGVAEVTARPVLISWNPDEPVRYLPTPEDAREAEMARARLATAAHEERRAQIVRRAEAGLVPCEERTCPAKEAPVTLEEWRDVAVHWKRHVWEDHVCECNCEGW